MTYPSISSEDASKVFELLREDELDDSALKELVVEKEGGDVNRELVVDLSDVLFSTVQSVGRKRGFQAEFDRIVAAEVHSRLSLSPIVAGDPGFWRWLTFSNDGDFASLVDWRYGGGEELVARAKYFALGRIKESMYGYLWLRADAVYDMALDDPYEFCRYGDVDIWQSHIVRVDFGSVPSMARSFIRFVHPEPGVQRLSREEYRALASELTRRNASILFELFDDVDSLDFVKELWKEKDSWMLKDAA